MCVCRTQGVVAQGLNNAAVLNLAPVAGRHHALQLFLKRAQLLQSRLDGGQIVLGDRVGIRAEAIRVIGEVQKRSDLVEFEAKLARVANKTQAPQFALAVKPTSALRSRRRRQQALRLIKADCRNFQSCPFRHRADRVHRSPLIL